MGCNTSKEAVAVQPPAPATDNSALNHEEEEIDIDLADPEVAGAATKIQAVFRGHRARRERVMRDGEPGGGEAEATADKPAAPQAPQPQPDTVVPAAPPAVVAPAAAVADTEADLAQEFNPDDPELCHAATRIQASFRGHMARKQTGKPDDELSKELEKLDAKGAEEEELDIDLTDPDLHKAATKIQASFRGHKVRKEDKPEDGKAGDEGAAGQ